MRIVQITVGAAHKLAIPGQFETINPSLSLTAEIGEDEDLATAVAQLKVRLDEQYWWLAFQDYAAALERVHVGTRDWLVAKYPVQQP